MALVPWDNTSILPHTTAKLAYFIFLRKGHMDSLTACFPPPALYFHGGVVPDDGYDNLI